MYGDVLLIDKTGTRPDIVIDITVASTHSANHHSTQPSDMADKAEKTKRELDGLRGDALARQSRPPACPLPAARFGVCVSGSQSAEGLSERVRPAPSLDGSRT